MTTVLVVDDEPQIARTLRINLTARGYQVVVAADGETALRAAADTKPDVVVLDLGLPDLHGTTVIRRLRNWSAVPIIVLSARTDATDKVNTLDAGADDYITKPFGMDELLARLRAAVRRATDLTPTDEATVIETPTFTIDLAAKKCTATAPRSTSPPPNGAYWRSWSAIPASSSRRNSSSPRSGEPDTPTTAIACVSTSPNSVASSNPSRPDPGISSPRRAWATASKPEP
jgi:CheY-like chemotaxis protein